MDYNTTYDERTRYSDDIKSIRLQTSSYGSVSQTAILRHVSTTVSTAFLC